MDLSEKPGVVMTGQTVLQAASLAKDYGEGFGLSPLDLEVTEGELVLLVGHNGSGKSTLLGLAAGLLEATEGEALIVGSPADSVAARIGRSYLPDQPILYDDLTLWEHIAYNAALHNTPDWEDAAVDQLEAFRLMDRVDDLPAKFSRGMRQKAAIVIGLVRPFQLLLIDEPFLGIDATGQDTLVDILKTLATNGIAVVVSTHHSNITDIATRCVGLRDGELVYDGAPDAETIRKIVNG
ncbi:SkfA peptide export ATP-binding protein SkfE [bacterium BMS3Bbin02]|nr:SkfA peptide export ATP-binding protein SkfE [bacterium BMS3Bbin02]